MSWLWRARLLEPRVLGMHSRASQDPHRPAAAKVRSPPPSSFASFRWPHLRLSLSNLIFRTSQVTVTSHLPSSSHRAQRGVGQDILGLLDQSLSGPCNTLSDSRRFLRRISAYWRRTIRPLSSPSCVPKSRSSSVPAVSIIWVAPEGSRRACSGGLTISLANKGDNPAPESYR